MTEQGHAPDRTTARDPETYSRYPDRDHDGYRILVVDDNPSIHDDFRRIFTPERTSTGQLDELAASMFGIEGAPARPTYSLDHVTQGQDALDRVIAAREGGRPYAVLFMDIRMPPGWDGVEACNRVLEVDPDAHVVLCTAYLERGWRSRVEALPGRDRVLILKKPFDILEVQQLARALCERWMFARRDRARMRALEHSVTEQRGRLAAAATHLRNEIASRTLAEDRLRKAQRLESLGRLAAGMCHEINNPLSFIVTSLELIERELQDLGRAHPAPATDELNQLVHTISVGTSRIMRIVRNIKMFARGTDQPAERVELDRTIEAAVGMVQRDVAPRVQLRVDLSGAVPVLGRRFELEQVLINLVENALQALADQRDPSPYVIITTRREEGAVGIEVTDNGPGIDEAILEQIFDPFFTTKSVGKGTGLGLSICKTLVQGMGGTLDVCNNEQRGATFTVTLPMAPTLPTTEPISGASSPVSADAERPGRVLVIDDEPLVLSTLEKLLRPHSITTTSSVQDALARCGSESFDAIICDIVMPGLDGRDFHRMLSQLRPGEQGRIIFITGGSMHDDVRDFLDEVPNHCLEKPFDSAELRALVAELVERCSTATDPG